MASRETLLGKSFLAALRLQELSSRQKDQLSKTFLFKDLHIGKYWSKLTASFEVLTLTNDFFLFFGIRGTSQYANMSSFDLKEYRFESGTPSSF